MGVKERERCTHLSAWKLREGLFILRFNRIPKTDNALPNLGPHRPSSPNLQGLHTSAQESWEWPESDKWGEALRGMTEPGESKVICPYIDFGTNPSRYAGKTTQGAT